MIATVSTVKDSAEGLARFVDRNLRAGADHMFVFLDEGDAAPGLEHLRSNPHVTAVVTDDDYWGGARPHALKLRQQAEASLAHLLLAAPGWASWLVHLDSDESIHVRRAELEALPPSVRAVRLSVWEAVSSADARDVRLFKRQLTASEEAVLHSLGHRRYFRGHRVGKTA